MIISAKFFAFRSREFLSKPWIPESYIVEQSEKFVEWVDRFLAFKEQCHEKAKTIMDIVVLNTLTLCPEENELEIWPTKVVADIIENIAGKTLDGQKRVASTFYCAKINNGGGMRTVGDGSIEYLLYEKYSAFSKKYKATHPATALALEYIADSYKQEADRDRRYSIKGHFYF